MRDELARLNENDIVLGYEERQAIQRSAAMGYPLNATDVRRYEATVRRLESRIAPSVSVEDATSAALMRMTEARNAWRDYAEHAAGCVECGETSWENCFDGKSLRDAAQAADTVAPSSTERSPE